MTSQIRDTKVQTKLKILCTVFIAGKSSKTVLPEATEFEHKTVEEGILDKNDSTSLKFRKVLKHRTASDSEWK